MEKVAVCVGLMLTGGLGDNDIGGTYSLVSGKTASFFTDNVIEVVQSD